MLTSIVGTNWGDEGKGRMIDQAEITKQSFIKFAEGLSDVALMDSEPKLDGRNMFMNLSPIPEKKKK